MIIQGLILIGAGFIAGIINAVAGGGSFIVLPLVISFGVPALIANTTTALSIQPGILTAAIGYRPSLKKLKKRYFLLLIPTFVGGVLGALLLHRTPNSHFEKLIPIFMLFAVFLMYLQPHIITMQSQHKKHKHLEEFKILKAILFTMLFLIVGIYGGYFGSGYGVIALAFIGLLGLKDMHQMNGLKNVLGLSLGFASVTYFIANGLIDWSIVPFIVTGSTIGGYVGSRYGSNLPTKQVRAFVIVVGLAVSCLLFYHYY